MAHAAATNPISRQNATCNPSIDLKIDWQYSKMSRQVEGNGAVFNRKRAKLEFDKTSNSSFALHRSSLYLFLIRRSSRVHHSEFAVHP